MIFSDMDRIVFAGDSITDAGSKNPVGEGLFDNVGRGYVRAIESMLAAYYPEVRLRVTNSGISGNTSRDLLARWQRDVLDLEPDWVSVCIGVNDVWRQFDSPAITSSQVLTDEYKQNVEEMIVSLKDKVKGIFILSPYYIENCRQDIMRARMDEYTEICRELADKHDCVFIDLQAMFDRYLKHRHSSSLAWDRVHPNQIASHLIAREFLDHCNFDYHHEY